MKNTKMVFIQSFFLAILSGCLAGENQQFFSTDYVCGALGDSSGSGIRGKLYYMTPDEVAKGYSGVADFLKRGKSPAVDFFMGRFYTPTRPFSEGFRMQNGNMVKDDQGNDLIEYFGFHFTSKIRLPAGSPAKYMQFALISDDGARFIIHKKNADGSIQRVVNAPNDGDHPTRMGCGTAPVLVSANDDLEIEVDYYQGPRYHIALTLVWREWNQSSSFNPNDQFCGQSGNNLFWDSSTTPSTPTSNWNNLMTRWQVVPTEVLVGDPNPCSGVH